MGKRRREPAALQRGKEFHQDVQAEWEHEFKDRGESVDCEHQLRDSRRRIDIHVDDKEGLVAVIEIKSTNWEKMTAAQVRRRVSEYAEQVWSYIDSELNEKTDVSPGIILLGLPADPDRLALVETLFEEEGIPVSWQDETLDEARARHARDT